MTSIIRETRNRRARTRSSSAALAPKSGKKAPLRDLARVVLEEAENAGLTSGAKSEHVSFRAPPALVEAAKEAAGVESTSELGILGLAMLAQTDPVAEYMKQHRGSLGEDHRLEY